MDKINLTGIVKSKSKIPTKTILRTQASDRVCTRGFWFNKKKSVSDFSSMKCKKHQYFQIMTCVKIGKFSSCPIGNFYCFRILVIKSGSNPLYLYIRLISLLRTVVSGCNSDHFTPYFHHCMQNPCISGCEETKPVLF